MCIVVVRTTERQQRVSVVCESDSHPFPGL